MTSKMTFTAAKADPRYLTVSDGNKKLVPTKLVKYIIWNLPAILTCPFATDLCKKACYAIKAERCYPSAKASRISHFHDAMKADFVERMIFTIEANLSRPSYQTARRVVVRIHESGDFFAKFYADAWRTIAEHFAGNDKVVFMAYTKSVRFFDGETIPENMVVRYSVWDDTDPGEIAIAERNGLPTYSAVDSFEKAGTKEKNKCHCDNCSTCNKCWSALSEILCEIH